MNFIVEIMMDGIWVEVTRYGYEWDAADYAQYLALDFKSRYRNLALQSN